MRGEERMRKLIFIFLLLMVFGCGLKESKEPEQESRKNIVEKSHERETIEDQNAEDFVGKIAQKRAGKGNNNLGIWLWYLEGTGYSSHAALAKDLAAIGVKRVYVKVADGGYNPSVWPEVNDKSLVQAYKSVGLEVWAWAYNYPGNDTAQANALYYAAKTGYEGFVTDIEIEFNKKTTELHNIFKAFTAARSEAIKNGYADSNFKLYCTTWGNPKDHGMRVDIIDQYVDGHMPQTYLEVWGTSYMNSAEYWVNAGTKEYRDMGAKKPIHHIVSAEHENINSSQINNFVKASGGETSLWRIPGGGTSLNIWNTIKNVNWGIDFWPDKDPKDEPEDITTHWAAKEIKYVLDKGYMSGYSDGTFRPDQSFTRAEFATMIASTLRPSAKSELWNKNFGDIKGHWAEQNILIAVRAGYLNGYSDGTFRPSNRVTKQEMLVALANGYGLSGGSSATLGNYYLDSNEIATWAKQAIANATKNNIVPNYPDLNKINITRNASRAEGVVALYQLMAKSGKAPAYNNPYIVKEGSIKANLDITVPSNIKVNEIATFTGNAVGIYKVVLSVDGYSLGETLVKNGKYSLAYKFTQAKNNRKLVANAFDQNGKSLTQKVKYINITGGNTSDFGSKFADYANNNWNSLKQEAVGAITGGTDCVAFVSAALRKFGYSINAVVTGGTSSEDAQGITLDYKLRQFGWSKGTNAASLKKGDVVFTINKWFSDNQGGNYYPTHAYIFMGWVTPGSTSYAWIVDNQGSRHQRNITASSPKDPFQYYMRAPSSTSDDDSNDAEQPENTVLIKNIPYFYQMYNKNNPSGSCQNTSIAMVLKYYGANVTPDQISNYYGTSKAQTVSGLQSVFDSEAAYFKLSIRDAGTTKGTFTKLEQQLRAGKPVIAHGYTTGYGHVVVFVGYDDNYYYVNDPYGKWDGRAYSSGYVKNSTAGKYVKYRKSDVKKAFAPDGYIWMHSLY